MSANFHEELRNDERCMTLITKTDEINQMYLFTRQATFSQL